MRFAIWGALSVLLSFPAGAADLSTAGSTRTASYIVENEWSGLYLGINVGYRSGSVTGTESVSAPGTVFSPPSVVASSESLTTSSGALAGIQVGINWQIDRFVFGFEGDYDTFLAGTADVDAACQTGAAGCSFGIVDHQRYFVTFRARTGYAFDRWLIYATGGAAWQNVGSDISLASGGGAPLTLLSTIWNIPVGWTAGLGLEAAISPNWIGRLEYLHLQSFTRQATGAGLGLPDGTTLSDTVRIRNNVVRIGLSYRFW